MVFVQDSFASERPCLWVCSTPIGNLDDVTLRLLDVLRAADIICAEDTRQTRKLLARYEIHGKTLVSYHQHNETARRAALLRWWAEGKRVALVSDAGTPLLSDPGEDAVSLALTRAVPVIPVPGPSALLAALAASGESLVPFTFVGFLPRRERDLEAALADIAQLPGSVVCYEAPHRLEATLRALAAWFPGRRVVIARELTKRHEQFVRGTVEEVLAFVQEQGVRGEYVLILEATRWLGALRPGSDGPAGGSASPPSGAGGADTVAMGDGSDRMAAAISDVQARMAAGATHTQAVREAAQAHGVPRRPLYQATLPRGGA
ncbi:16S rRNA (cytidine(1402)-2'-O)-methyltransferase [Alicyclobacillus shizuokensis]|uniref:16S rRNA (cytidine(1402)-2'-O)-methyltransferase n=1 Tax=Alicyclobacillus shizuokensis TaxID=392014 RepID=UPI00083186A5|nr:16S rRNA (cytidine(1402)-2'-O)-methyltransferase [Alicyclobacillus shizuokensis]MCL6627887.1 16S rRNA (cytidine(1402)-2'-O)-methyltransferase [Alicyclobacillus shizuokensis]